MMSRAAPDDGLTEGLDSGWVDWVKASPKLQRPALLGKLPLTAYRLPLTAHRRPRLRRPRR